MNCSVGNRNLSDHICASGLVLHIMVQISSTHESMSQGNLVNRSMLCVRIAAWPCQSINGMCPGCCVILPSNKCYVSELRGNLVSNLRLLCPGKQCHLKKCTLVSRFKGSISSMHTSLSLGLRYNLINMTVRIVAYSRGSIPEWSAIISTNESGLIRCLVKGCVRILAMHCGPA
jgi:hypothetical protein